jgi:hypothetical protein
MIETIPCRCGRQITMNDAAQTITHPPPECDYFRGVIERNERGYPLSEHPPVLPSPTEDAEVELMVVRTPAEALILAARGFGVPAPDPTTAARNCLREMRRRGYIIHFP